WGGGLGPRLLLRILLRRFLWLVAAWLFGLGFFGLGLLCSRLASLGEPLLAGEFLAFRSAFDRSLGRHLAFQTRPGFRFDLLARSQWMLPSPDTFPLLGRTGGAPLLLGFPGNLPRLTGTRARVGRPVGDEIVGEHTRHRGTGRIM